jgi:hypothetical protein
VPRDVKDFEYPPKVSTSVALGGLWQTSKLDFLFHGLMAILLATGLVIDLLGPYIGGSLLVVRRYSHGYLGAALVVLYPFYLIKLLAPKKSRMLLTAINYIDFVIYAVLILTGVAIASVNQPWIDVMPWLASTLSVLRVNATMIHTVTTYVFLLVSILLPGGFLHGIASMFLGSDKRVNA